ncbi:heme-binding protein [Polaribacter sp.]|nr:heme-binding protein [Polaribacter sp.]
MKTFLIILGLIFLLFLGSQIYFYRSSQSIEGYKYSTIKTYKDFEIRTYQASLFTSVKIHTDNYKQGSSKGFSVLGGYIFGKNENKEQIPMTSPVAMTLEKKEMNMRFLVPEKFTKENLPKPENIKIKFIEIPEKKMAAITFSGWASDEKIEKYKLLLIKLLDKNGIKYANKFSVLGYNPPYEVFFRRNEIIVELE